MDWIALQPAPEDMPAWGWQALRFTPRVARVEEAWLLELSASWRLFGGRAALRRALLRDDLPQGWVTPPWAAGPTALVALALLRLRAAGEPLPPAAQRPDALRLDLLSAARPHLPLLARSGLRTWGELRALPRAPVARRFGRELLLALDQAWGQAPETYVWQVLPEVFEQSLELPAIACSAPELMAAAWRLLGQLQLWLRARQRGVLAFGLEWRLDLRRLDGVALPPTGDLVVRTAEPVQAMDHLGRLLREQLARTTLAAPARSLRLYSIDTVPWGGAARTLLSEEVREGDRLHQLVERLSARLGPARVQRPRLQADWRPEAMQRWEPAQAVGAGRGSASAPAPAPAPVSPSPSAGSGDAAAPYPSHAFAGALSAPWLVEPPLLLSMEGEQPCYQGRLELLTRRQRIETGWWEPGGVVVRDYCIARSARAGLLWVFCEHAGRADSRTPRWYLQGLYA